MVHQPVSDASFYSLLHYVLEAQHLEEDVAERRASDRHEFTSLQFVAPYRDGRLPSDDQFEQVLCKDLSPNGLSYVTAEPPDTEYMVVALGSPSPIFLSAAVRRHWPITLGKEHLHLVAVRFISRINGAKFGQLIESPPDYAAAYLVQI